MTKYNNPFQAEYDGNGEPLSGGKLNFYDAGTTDAQPVYSDEDLVTPLSNPVVADASGRFPTMYMQKIVYKIVLTDSDDVVIATEDDVDFTGATLFNDIKIYATTTESGVVTLATASDVITGTDALKAVTPLAINEALQEISVSPKNYFTGAVTTVDDITPDELINITSCEARSSNNEIDIIVSETLDFDINTNANWASGTAPSLTSIDIYLWAVYDATSSFYIFDDETGSNIVEPRKRLVVLLSTDGSSDIIEDSIVNFSMDNQSTIDRNMPDHNNAIALSVTSYVALENGWVSAKANNANTCFVENTTQNIANGASHNTPTTEMGAVPCSKGDTITLTTNGSWTYRYFTPLKGGE